MALIHRGFFISGAGSGYFISHPRYEQHSEMTAYLSRQHSRAIALLSVAALASSASARLCDPMLPDLVRVFSASPAETAHVVSGFSVAYGLMQAFFDADVVDVELLYDNAMMAVNYQQAAKYGIKYISVSYTHLTLPTKA